MPPQTLLCVPIMADDAESALADARQARDLGADLVEMRIDRLFHGEGDDEGAAVVARLVAESPLPLIVTCRAADEGGEYDGDDSARVSLYESLGTGERGQPPAYVDLELSTYERSANLRQKVHLAIDHPAQIRDVRTRLILSHHDFEKRPERLFDVLGRMRASDGARVLKLAWHARSLRDNLEIFELLSEKDRPTIALAMGRFGLMSRVLAPKFGGFLTFASLRDSGATAPGQPTVRELIDAYRFRSIGPSTRVYGVAGWPVEHSLSPALHNAAFEATGHDGVYLPMPIPEGWEHFKATVLAMLDFKPLDLRGLSVTIPHKTHLVRLAREDTSRAWSLDPLADRLGAANTLVVDDDGACRVLNTDGAGVVEPLAERLGGLSGKRVMVLGAGGAARSAAGALAQAGAHVMICARRTEAAAALAGELGAHWPGAFESGAIGVRIGDSCEVLVNCTPAGMRSGTAPDQRAIDLEQARDSGALAEDSTVFETVYAPLRTPLVEQAESLGFGVITGDAMFIVQASAQFQEWTGVTAPKGLMRRVFDESLPGAPT